MEDTQQLFLPTEVVVQIATAVAADEHQRQPTLHACCLVSRQWYSASIALLYEKPRFGTGTAFKRFAETISPPIGVRKSKWNLGSFVHRLDLGALVHHSSNSLTARLLNRVKGNLDVLIAPRVSFSVNSLPALSKCTKLRHLDLALVGENIGFLELKKALRHLSLLVSLRLPQSTDIPNPEPSPPIPWPPLLHRLQFSGRFSPDAMATLAWPPSLTSLAIKNCNNLSVENLSSLMSNPDLGRTLKRLTVSGRNRGLTFDSINAILTFLPDLSYLSVPGDMVQNTFFELLCLEPRSLQVLEFGFPFLDANLYFSTEDLLKAINFGLPKLRSVGFADIFSSDDRITDDDEIEEALLTRANTNDFSHDIEPGVYYV